LYFFYNINIYKELKEYDLKINLKRKEDLIAKAKALEEEKSIKKCETAVKQLQNEWNEIGSSPQESYKETGNAFFAAIRNVYAKIQKHYDDLRAEMEQNLLKKKELITEVKKLLEQEITLHSAWTKKTEELKAIQDKWRSIGFAQKKENDLIWDEFKSLCDIFFERKKQFYAVRHEEFAVNRDKKEKLIEKALSLQNDTNWDVTAKAFINLQKDWKNAGNTFQKDEHKLWLKFRTACDFFFEKKKEHFEKQDTEQSENLKAKLDLIEEVKAFQLSGNVNDDMQMLKKFSEKWNAVGPVSEKKNYQLNSTYGEIVNKKISDLIANGEQQATLSYEQKIEVLKTAPNGSSLIEKENSFLRKKIEKLQQEVNQYENNLGFFANSKGSNPLIEEVKKKVKDAETEIAAIKKQLQLTKTNVAVPQ